MRLNVLLKTERGPCGSRSFNVSIMIVLREAERLPELLVKTMKMAATFTGEPGIAVQR